MTITNYIFIIVGGLVAIIGIAAFFLPSLTKIINFPGGPKIKAIATAIIGIILIITGFIVNLPANA